MSLNVENENEAKPYLTTLTPLRGIAAMFVVMHHSSVFFGSFIPHSVTYFFENSWIWVDFFFILSGFILSYSYGSNFEDGITFRDYRKYIGARFARIYPLHFITLLWAFIVVAAIVYMAASIDIAVAGLYNLKALLPSLFLIQALHLYNSSPLNFPAWSLSAEWWMYLIFPFLVPYFSSLTKLKKLFTLLLVIAGYITIRFVCGPVSGIPPAGRPTINMSTDFGMLRCIAGFCTGMLLFVFYQGRNGYSIFKKNVSFILFFSITLLAIHSGITDILIIALFPFILLTAAYNETAIKKILGVPVLQRLGDWSFSIYMVHGPIILMLVGWGVYKDPAVLSNAATFRSTEGDVNAARSLAEYKTSFLYCGALLVATLVVSAFTHRFVEIPGRKYLKRVFKTKQEP